MQNLPKELSEYEDLPLYVFFPADREPLDAFLPDGYGIQSIMRYVQDNAVNKFDLPKFPHLSEHEYSAKPLGEKVSHKHVIDLEEKRKAMDKKWDEKYSIKEDL